MTEGHVEPPAPVRPKAPMLLATSKDPFQRGARIFLALVILLGLADAVYTPDLSRDGLIAKYAPEPSKFLTLPSRARVHYRDEAPSNLPNAPTLVLVHGSNSSLHTWEPWVAQLHDRFRIVRFDLPGHGLTGPVPGDDYSVDGMVRFLDQVRIALALPRFALAGNSLGGNIGWRYTLAHPDVVSALILVDAGGVNHLLPPDAQPKPPIGFKLARTPGLNLLMSVITPRSLVEKTTRAVFVDQRKVDEAMIDRYYELLLFPGNRRATRLRAAAPPNDALAERLSEIKTPTLILSGQKDTLAPVQSARIFHQRIAGSQLIEYPNVGHLPMEEIPERSANDVREFLLHVRL